MKSVNLELLSEKIKTFAEERDWDQFHSIKNLSMAMSVEASEVVELFQWLTEAQSNQVSENSKLREKLEDEIADVAVYLIRILQKSGIELESAILKKLQKNAEKYPVALAKGNATKYSDLGK